MNNTIRKTLYILLTSLGLALVFNYLFFEHIPGISVFVFAALLLGSVYMLGKYEQVSLKKSWWLAITALFFAFMPAIRANGFLTFLNVVATFGLLMLLAHQLVGTPVFLMKLRDYILLAVLVPFKMLGRALSTVSLIGQIHSSVQKRDVWVRILKGAIMALPILIIFGLLFAQADLAFSQFLSGFINITISDRTVGQILLTVFAFVASIGFLSYIFLPKQQQAVTEEKSEIPVQSGRRVEVLVFLSLIGLLFLLFIGFQITYLFGGESNIANAGFTYAEYARRGFFELLAVAMLSLLVLLASEKYAHVEQKKDKRFLTPALILITEVVVVIISAFKRLSLYIDAYSLTTLRFYVAGFIIVLAVLFILLAIKFIKSKAENFFTFATLLCVLTFLVVVNFMNPDKFIAKSNLDQYSKTGKIDVIYVGKLSADAIKEKIELLKKVRDMDKQNLEALLDYEEGNLEVQTQSWQSFNLSRSKALESLKNLGE